MKIAQMFRFPIKGLPGEVVTSVDISKGKGLEGDRRVAFGNGTTELGNGEWESCLNFTILKNNKSLQKWEVHSKPP
ncbi:MAG: MOSC domain-containing protein, partial [Glutamicibacter arilaitensis]